MINPTACRKARENGGIKSFSPIGRDCLYIIVMVAKIILDLLAKMV
nr:MAG TPA: hypothetical protein [Caudoviricetes sp.]